MSTNRMLCPTCRSVLAIGASITAGMQFRCSKCGQILVLPAGPTAIQPAQPAEPPRPAAAIRPSPPTVTAPAPKRVAPAGRKMSRGMQALLAGCGCMALVGGLGLGLVGKVLFDRFNPRTTIAQVSAPPAQSETKEPQEATPEKPAVAPSAPIDRADKVDPAEPPPDPEKPALAPVAEDKKTPVPPEAKTRPPAIPPAEPKEKTSGLSALEKMLRDKPPAAPRPRPAPEKEPPPLPREEAPPPPEEKPARAGIQADLARLKLPVPRFAKYERDKKRWVYSLQATGNTYGIFYIDLLPAGAPTTLAGYAEKLRQKDFQDQGQQFTEITEKSELPDGFFIQGVVKEQGSSKPELGFVIVRKVNGAYLRCRNGRVKERPAKDEELRQWIRDVMKQATIRTTTLLSLPTPSGSVLLSDHVTLIVALAEKGQLAYFDTMSEREIKRVDLDFQPGELALQGGTLFATAKGSALVYALDAATGKTKKQYNLGGEAVVKLACHPDKGLLFASTLHFDVESLDPASGKVRKPKAKGQFLAVSPDGKFLYTGVQPEIHDEIEVIVRKGYIRIFSDMWGPRSMLIKYAVEGGNLRPVSGQNNAAVNGRWMHLTPDGKRLLMVGGGGWRPPKEGGTGGGYITAVFSTDDLQTMLQPIEFSGLNTIFHPVLNLGVANSYGLFLTLFNGKSLVKREVIALSPQREDRPALLTFGGKGRKLILWNGDNVTTEQGLHFLPLPLKAEEEAALEKTYGR